MLILSLFCHELFYCSYVSLNLHPGFSSFFLRVFLKLIDPNDPRNTIQCRYFYYEYHCSKSVQIRNFFWSSYSCIRTEYGDLLSLYSTQIQENTDQRKLHIACLFSVHNIISLSHMFNEVMFREILLSSSSDV